MLGLSYRLVTLFLALAAALPAQYGTTPKPRAEDYPRHAAAEGLSIGADYTIHSFSGGREMFIAQDYLVVEVALFPEKGKTLAVNARQFTLRLNHKKDALAPQAP